MARKFVPSIVKGSTPLPVQFPSNMSIQIEGYGTNPDISDKIVSEALQSAARFVGRHRQQNNFNSNDFFTKAGVIGDFAFRYTAAHGQEVLNIVINPKRLKKPTGKEKDEDKKCLLILHGNNKIIATDMLGVSPGKLGPVVYSTQLKQSDFSLAPVPAELFDWTENQFDPRTVQMTNSLKMGPVAVTPFKIEDFVITHDYRFHVWRIGLKDVWCSDQLEVSSYFNLFPTLSATDEIIYADRHSFAVGSDGVPFETSKSVWGEADYWTNATLMHTSLLGSPRYIDNEQYAHYWFALMFMDEIVDVSINQNGSSFYDAVNPEAYYPPDVDFGDVNNELRRRSVGGGLTTYKYPDTTFPFPYLEQKDGVDTLRTQYCSIAGSKTNIDTKIITYVLEGKQLDSWNWMSSDKSRLYVHSFPYPTEPSTWTTIVEKYNDEYIDYMTTYYGDEITNGYGRIATANGTHYFQMWAENDPAITVTAYMDGENCTSELDKVCEGPSKDVKAVFMDVPLSWIKKLK